MGSFAVCQHHVCSCKLYYRKLYYDHAGSGSTYMLMPILSSHAHRPSAGASQSQLWVWKVNKNEFKLLKLAVSHLFAQAISRGITKSAVGVETLNLETCPLEEVEQTIRKCDGFIIGELH